MKSKTISVAIIEDRIEIANAIRALINETPDLICRQTYQLGGKAIDALVEEPTDLALVDLGLPDVSGLVVLRKIAALAGTTQCSVFTALENTDHILEGIRAGAKGYVLKNDDPPSIIQKLRELHMRQASMRQVMAQQILWAFEESQRKPSLSRFEKDVLRYCSKGFVDQEIAKHLDRTVVNVKQCFYRIYAAMYRPEA